MGRHNKQGERTVEVDIIGRTFGRLTVLSFVEYRNGTPYFSGLCECGNHKIVRRNNLLFNQVRSCGCLHREMMKARATHGMSHTREHDSWLHAKDRCKSMKRHNSHRYAGRGITMCEEWLNSFEAFYRDMGPCPEGMTLDRIDVNKGYEPGNCRWATYLQQANNRACNRLVTYRRKTQTVAQWARDFNMPYHILLSRLNRGWSIHKAHTVPWVSNSPRFAA